MLTYATLEDFKIAKQITQIKQGTSGASQQRIEEGENKIQDYLLRATAFIKRFTRRDFFPWRENRTFPIPHSFLDLSMRRFTLADLYLDNDLLEVHTLINGTSGGTLSFGTDYFLLESNITPHYAIQLKFPNFWGGQSFAATSYSYEEPVIEIDAIWGFHNGYKRTNEAWVDTLETVQDGGITETQSSLTITSITGRDANYMRQFTVGNLLKIEDEFLEVVEITAGTSPDPHTMTVLRGVRGTIAAAHDEGTKIYRWLVEPDITEACLQIAKTWRESDTSAGGRFGVNDVSAGVEIGIPADPLNTIKMYQRSIVGLGV